MKNQISFCFYHTSSGLQALSALSLSYPLLQNLPVLVGKFQESTVDFSPNSPPAISEGDSCFVLFYFLLRDKTEPRYSHKKFCTKKLGGI